MFTQVTSSLGQLGQFVSAIPLAEDGFEVNSELEMSIKKYSKGIDKSSPFFKGDGNTVKNGEHPGGRRGWRPPRPGP